MSMNETISEHVDPDTEVDTEEWSEEDEEAWLDYQERMACYVHPEAAIVANVREDQGQVHKRSWEESDRCVCGGWLVYYEVDWLDMFGEGCEVYGVPFGYVPDSDWSEAIVHEATGNTISSSASLTEYMLWLALNDYLATAR